MRYFDVQFLGVENAGNNNFFAVSLEVYEYVYNIVPPKTAKIYE
jgi:hypothetical protein